VRRVKVKALRCPIYEIIFLHRILLRFARPGTQCDRSLKRPVTAPCSHHPPTLQEIYGCSIGMRSPELDPPGAHATRRWSPCSGSRHPARIAVCISPPDPVVPALGRGYRNILSGDGDCIQMVKVGKYGSFENYK